MEWVSEKVTQALQYIEMVEFMKDHTLIMKRRGLDVKYIVMATCMLESTIKTKNMEKELSFGSANVKEMELKTNTQRLSNMKVCGGEACQMDKDSTKNQMVFLLILRGFLYGSF